jgi:hypothetical protein
MNSNIRNKNNRNISNHKEKNKRKVVRVAYHAGRTRGRQTDTWTGT